MKFSPYVTDLLKQKSHKEFRTSGDCEFLSLDIESVTGEHIGVNTLKRLLGFINDEREARISTLDVIARYLGFENWEVLSIYDNRSNYSFESSSEEIRVSDSISRSAICQTARWRWCILVLIASAFRKALTAN